jgi:hypothetical protein
MADPIKIDLDPSMAMALQIQQFDKKIAEAEAQVADLKRHKCSGSFSQTTEKCSIPFLKIFGSLFKRTVISLNDCPFLF